jgi:hypothetical protein
MQWFFNGISTLLEPHFTAVSPCVGYYGVKIACCILPTRPVSSAARRNPEDADIG